MVGKNMKNKIKYFPKPFPQIPAKKNQIIWNQYF
jgi:hypothetical protein